MSKTVLAFDVAIKTLSFCILEYIPPPKKTIKILQSGLKFNIRKWVIVNLIENDTFDCCHTSIATSKKPATPCTKKATHYLNVNGAEPKYYCGIHVKTVPVELLKNVKEIVLKNTKNTPLKEINTNLVRELDKYPELLEVDEIVIENQRAKQSINAKMIEVSTAIYFYFMVRGVDKSKLDLNVRYVPANNNLSTSGNIEFQTTDKTHPDPYKRKKAQSVEYASHIIPKLDQSLCNYPYGDNKSSEQWLEEFNSHSKRDDLADSLTHAYSVIVKDFCVYTDFKTKQERNQKKGRNRVVDPSEIIKL